MPTTRRQVTNSRRAVLLAGCSVWNCFACSSSHDEGDQGSGGNGAYLSSSGGSVSGGGQSSGGSTPMASGGTVGGGGEVGGGGQVSGDGGSGASIQSGGSDAGSSGGGSSVDPTCSAGLGTTTPQVLTLSGNTFAHDPTMIKVEDTFYRFWTGDFIPSASSTNLTQWSDAPSVYKNVYPSWVNPWLAGVSNSTFNFPWAPDVSSFNDQIHIYSSFSAKFGDNVSCITHLTTSAITSGNWTDHGPILCTEGNENYNAIDADVGFDETGTPYLAFGSFWNGIYVVELNADGSRKGDEQTHVAWANEIEAPVLFRRCGYYYLFVTWGLCCPGEGRSVNQLSYRVAVGRSKNILGPYVDQMGKAMTEGGGTVIVEGDKISWAAAGHSDVLVDGDKIYHLYHAYAQSNGNASFRIAELFFDEEGWPVPHAP